MSENIGISVNISLFTIHDSQGARDAWDTAQNTVSFQSLFVIACTLLDFTAKMLWSSEFQ